MFTLLHVSKSSASFSPLDISGLQLWLKADAIAGLNDGDSVTTWVDSSGNSNDATQATAAKKPIYKVNIVNGKPVMRFDGTDDRMATPAIATFPVKRGTIFLVANKPAAGAAFQAFMYKATAPDWEFMSDNNSIDWYDGVTTQDLQAITPTGWMLHSLVRSADTVLDYWRNAVSIIALTIANNQPAVGVLGLASTGASEFFNGDIAELLIYDTALSTANRQAVENYLNARFAIY